MRYAEVAVNAPVGCDRTLTYSVPPPTSVVPGQLVWVPLGARPVQGIVFSLSQESHVENVRDLGEALEPSPLVSSVGLALAHWISDYYMSPLFGAAALFLPPGFRTRVITHIQAVAGLEQNGTENLNDAEKRVISYIHRHSPVDETRLKKVLGRRGERAVTGLLRKGLVVRRRFLPAARTSPTYDSFVHLAMQGWHLSESIERLERSAPRQVALLRSLASADQQLSATLARKEFGSSALNALMKKGLVALEWRRPESDPAPLSVGGNEGPLVLTTPQEQALAQINTALDRVEDHPPRSFLLYGVTGSGKTEIYIRALAHVVAQGKQGLLLVPEISLTPQMVHRLVSRFPGRVGVLHSKLSLREQFDQWWRIRQGEYDIVIGPRSALFAPLDRLGLIVLDEEHEWTYKQQDQSPRYHARDGALQLATLTGAIVVLGSATPDVESYYRAQRGQYRSLELPERIAVHSMKSTSGQDGSLATVQVVDMRKELKEGNRSIFSRALAQGLQDCVSGGQRAILFLNRRGSATVVQCRACGQTMRCRRCAVALTYHSAGSRLRCHQCNYSLPIPSKCPNCRSPYIKYLGLGTQRVVDEVQELLPAASVLRWDRDTAPSAREHQLLMESFATGEAQVLVGTQMVAKGLHVPEVTLVGVVLADIGLSLPDFRAGEHTFQLLCQVVGRSGRGPQPGKAIVQTYNPDSYVVQAAAQQDFSLLYRQELEFRREQRLPPFSRLVHLVHVHTNAVACQKEAERMARQLRHLAYTHGLTDPEVVGPAPAYPERVRGRYRWHLLLRGTNPAVLLTDMPLPQGWTIDVDPVSVL